MRTIACTLRTSNAAFLALLLHGPLAAQQSYSEFPMTIEYDVKVTMRDGVKLSVDVYRPRDGAKHPTIFQLTPYNNLGDNTMTAAWRYVRRGYAYVTADVRGRFDSEGDFVPYRNDGKDGSDIISWIALQPWSDAKVATTGGSYGGKNQWMIAKENNPHHVAMLPTVAPADEFHDGVRYNGVPKLDLMYTWSMGMDGREAQPRQNWNWAAAMRKLPLVTLDSVVGREVPWWRQMMTNDALSEFWDPVQIRGHYEKFSVPSFNVSGWWDGQLKGAVQGYTNAVRTGKASDHVLVIGPWPHGVNRNTSWGELDYGPGAIIPLDSIRDAWLDARMLGKAAPSQANVMYFLPGKNEWRQSSAFPLPETKYTQFFLDSQGKANTLNGDGVLKTGSAGAGQADEFVSNPADPVPTVSSRTSGARGGLKVGAADHRQLEARSDVLVYTGDVLREGLEITGPVKATIFFSTDAPDVDIAVKLLNVYPDGRALNLSEGIARARYRTSYSQPELLEPGKVYSIEVELFPTANYFPPGHRIRIEVTGSDFPNFARNLQTGKNNETTSEMRPARIRIHHTRTQPSNITLPVIPATLLRTTMNRLP